MKYKIKNKTEAYVKYSGIIFKPKEEKIIELTKIIPCDRFHIEELEELKKTMKKLKGGKK